MSFGWFKSYLGPISWERQFYPPPIIQERVKYLFYPTFDDRHIGCLGKISKMGLIMCPFIYLLSWSISCLRVRFIFKRIDHSCLRFKEFREKFFYKQRRFLLKGIPGWLFLIYLKWDLENREKIDYLYQYLLMEYQDKVSHSKYIIIFKNKPELNWS